MEKKLLTTEETRNTYFKLENDECEYSLDQVIQGAYFINALFRANTLEEVENLDNIHDCRSNMILGIPEEYGILLDYLIASKLDHLQDGIDEKKMAKIYLFASIDKRERSTEDMLIDYATDIPSFRENIAKELQYLGVAEYSDLEMLNIAGYNPQNQVIYWHDITNLWTCPCCETEYSKAVHCCPKCGTAIVMRKIKA